jgi:hypothetical protein
MNAALLKPHTAFAGHRRLASGPLQEVALAAQTATASGVTVPVLIYDDATGRLVDIDPRAEIDPTVGATAQASPPPSADTDPTSSDPRGRGRPRLGVIAREVTLLPRHWDWLNTQPGGASVALRKLVEEARRTSGDRDRIRAAQEAAYNFMSSIGGDLPGFEEASRALFAYDRRRFGDLLAAWPVDVRDHAIKLAFSDLEPSVS